MTWLPTPETPLIEAARLYIEHGLRVVIVHGVIDGKCTCERRVCPKPGKHPVSTSWQKKKYATHTEFCDALNSRRMPETPNLGIGMGEQLDGQHIIGIDIDRAERLVELESAVGSLPPSLGSRSGGGGSHRVYALGPGQDPKRLKNRVGVRLSSEDPSPETVGVDVRVTGGQIVVCPSVHELGGRYEWVDRIAIAELPQAWFDLIADPADMQTGPRARPLPGSTNVYPLGGRDRYLETVIENNCRDIASRGKGERNQVLFAKSCTVLEHCAGAGVAFERALERLRDAGLACGLPRGEVIDTLRKAEKHVRRTGATRVPPAPEPPRSVRVATRAATSSTHPVDPVDPVDDVPTEAPEPDPDVPDESWRVHLLSEKGRYEDCLANVITVLGCHHAWKGVLQYDMFRETIVFTRQPPCRAQDAPMHRPQGNVWLEADDTRTQAWINENVGFEPSKSMVADAVTVVAERAAVHPVRDYLASLEWDGEERLPTFLANYFGATPNAYTAGIGTCWMISGVARVSRPGEQVDYMLVLEGEQGLGKSSGVRALMPSPEWFSDTGIVLGQKDSYMTLHGLWIYGFDELDSLRGNELTKTKSFLTSTSDRLRPPYGRRMRDFPRQTIFIGTTNESEYLRDRTGNRRFWPVACTKIDVDAIRRDRDQLWAEARVRFEQGEKWWPDADLIALCREEQLDRTTQDPWMHPVAEWLESDRAKTLVSTHGGVLTHDVLVSGLGFKSHDIGRFEEVRVAEVLRELGWASGKQRREDGQRVRRYLPRVTGCDGL